LLLPCKKAPGPLWLDDLLVFYVVNFEKNKPSLVTVCFFHTKGPLWLDSGPLWLDGVLVCYVVNFEKSNVSLVTVCFFHTNKTLWLDSGPLWLDGVYGAHSCLRVSY